jgi:hypothetical protein
MALHEFAPGVFGLSVIDEHPRVIPARSVGRSLADEHPRPSGAWTGHPRGSERCAGPGYSSDAACDSPSTVMSLRGTVLPRLASKSRRSVTDEHPRVIPVSRSVALSLADEHPRPSGAWTGHPRGSERCLGPGYSSDAASDSPSPVLGIRGTVPTRLRPKPRREPGAPSLTSYPCRRIANSVKSSKPRLPLVNMRRSSRQAVIRSAG